MADKIITFRPSAAAQSFIDIRRRDGENISAWINHLVETEGEDWRVNYERKFRFYPMGGSVWGVPAADGGPLPRSFYPVGQLSILYYNDYIHRLHEEGLQLYRFPIDKDLTFSIIAVNQSEASVELQKYYTRASEAEPYVRTTRPLPQIQYDIHNRVICIQEYERK